ncbi:uncharacterized protein LOC111137606 [Crassostrea virginica]
MKSEMPMSVFTGDDTQHDLHHHFIKDPEKVYQENYMKYCFGDKYITPEGLEYLQNILDERMCANKLLPGSIFSRYATFCNCSNKKLEQIFIAYPLMGRQYIKFIILKEAVVYLVCQLTGLPYEETDTRCSATNCLHLVLRTEVQCNSECVLGI